MAGPATLVAFHATAPEADLGFPTARQAIAFCCFLFAAVATAAALPLGAMRHDSWNELQGAPQNIYAIAQTGDGWIWLGTPEGLFRFDGVKFLPFVASNGTRPLGAPSAFLPDEQGNLYVSYGGGGLSVVRGDTLTHLADGDTLNTVWSITRDRQGVLWAATNGGLYRYLDGNFERIGTPWGYTAAEARYVHSDQYGRLWVASKTDIFLRDGDAHFSVLRATDGDSLIIDGPGGEVWLVHGKQIERLPAPPTPSSPPRQPVTRRSSFQTVFDRDGNLWTGNCPVGMCRLPAGYMRQRDTFSALEAPAERIDQPWQLSSLTITSMMEDREGNIWAGTVQGLERFRHQGIHMVSGLQDQIWLSADFDHAGTVWAASRDLAEVARLWKIDDGRAAEQANPSGFVITGHGDGVLLLGGPGGIERRSQHGVQHIALPVAQRAGMTRIYTALSEAHGAIWLRLTGEGLFRWREGTWTLMDPGAAISLRSYALDPRGRLWMGYRGNRIRLLDRGRWSALGPAQGVAVGAVTFIGAGNDFVISGPNGLQAWHGDRFRMLAVEGFPGSPQVKGIAIGSDGSRWLNTPKGVLRVPAHDWHRSMADPRIALRGKLMDQADGYQGGAAVANLGRNAFASPDGTIWLVSARGLAAAHPASLQRNTVAPRSVLLGLRTRDRSYRVDALSVLPAGTAELAIDYTALSYRTPERTRFRYRLEGLDTGWRDAGARREAIYTNLGPGTYRFEVRAMNEDGVEGPAVSSPPIRIEPTFMQSGWFALIAALAVAALLAAAYHLRLRHLKRRFAERNRAQLEERERIARTLHDSFLQSVQGLLLRVHAAAMRLPASDPVRAMLEKALQTGDETLAEGRDQVCGLRNELPEGTGLVPALRHAIADMDCAGCSIEVAGEAPGLDGWIATEIYAIVKEAIGNALQHSGATAIRVRLEHYRGDVTVSVIDNGCGIDSPNGFVSPPGHFGLQGMAERAARISATLRIAGTPQGGTTVALVLAVPLYGRLLRRLGATFRPAPARATAEVR